MSLRKETAKSDDKIHTHITYHHIDLCNQGISVFAMSIASYFTSQVIKNISPTYDMVEHFCSWNTLKR